PVARAFTHNLRDRSLTSPDHHAGQSSPLELYAYFVARAVRQYPRDDSHGRRPRREDVDLLRKRESCTDREVGDIALPYPVVQHLDAAAWDALHPDLKLFVRVQ